MNNKYDVFIQLLNFNRDRYTAEKVFKDFISLFAISLSNKVYFNQENSNMYQRIYESYEKEEQFNFYISVKLKARLKNVKSDNRLKS